MRAHVALATVALLASSCATSRDVTHEHGQNVSTASLALTQADSGVYQLFVSQDALNNGTEFLLSTSALITDYGEPSFNGMLSRVVFFKRADGQVQLLESQKGATLDPALTKPNVIASFNIVTDDGSGVGLDFNEGVSKLSLAFDWNASDGTPPEFAFQDRFSPLELIQRYVDEGKTDDKGRITVRQIAQVDQGGLVSTMELRYFLQPYQPDPSFPALVSKQDFRWSGFFESGASIVPGTTSFQQFVSRFHPGKPLKYAISSNTPAEVKEAVRDGILYWNRALGRDWIEVVDAPDGVTGPNLDYNLIQWVPEKGATFAYADAQLDPLTGEVKNAQVFFPSGWYDSTELQITDGFARRAHDIEAARAGLANRQSKQAKQSNQARAQSDQQGAKPKTDRWHGGCELINTRKLEAASKLMLKRGVTGPEVKRAALDWVRSAISHEVGHTLGLRHDFAGSLGSTIAPDEVDGLLQNYFATFEWPADKIPGSSVMEYPAFEDDLAIGAHIRSGHPALVHDIAAIQYLYNGGAQPEGGALFCTDSEQGSTPDCTPYDSGTDIVASLRKQILDDVDNVAVEYVYWLRAAKNAEIPDVFAATAADIDATSAYGRRAQVARLLSSDSVLLSAERAIGSAAINQKEIHEDSLKRVGRSILEAGGYADFFGLLPDDFDARFYAKLEDLLNQSWINTGTTVSGGVWAFTPDELSAIAEYAPKYLKIWRAAAADADIAVLSQQDPSFAQFASSEDVIFIGDSFGASATWEPPVLVDELQNLLVARAEYYATATSGELSAEVAVLTDGTAEEEPEEEPAPEKPKKRKWAQPGDAPSGDDGGDTPETPETPEPTTVTRTLTLPIFTYATETRSRAAGLVSSSTSKDRLWLRGRQEEPATALSSLLDEVAGGSFSSLQLDGSEPAAQYWILDNQDVLSAFGGAPVDETSSAEPVE